MVQLNDLLTKITNSLFKVQIRLFFVIVFFFCCAILPLLRIIPYCEVALISANNPTPKLTFKLFLFQTFSDYYRSLSPLPLLQSIHLTGFLMIICGSSALFTTLFTILHQFLFKHNKKSQLFDLTNFWALFFAIAHISIFTLLIIITPDIIPIPSIPENPEGFYVRYNMDLWWIYVLGILSLLIGNLVPISRLLKRKQRHSRFLSQSTNSDSYSSNTSRDFILSWVFLLIFFLCCVVLPLLQLFPYDFYFVDFDYVSRYNYYKHRAWQLENILHSIELTNILTILAGMCTILFAIKIFFTKTRYTNNISVHAFHLSSVWAIVFAFLHISIFTLWNIEESRRIHTVLYISPFYLESKTLNFWLGWLFVLGLCSLLLVNFLVIKKEIPQRGDFSSQ